ncbi:hypothetical protein GUJ93_ZPchr0003g18338 [Zizania palustris]|uniref:Uncharacterized protein n=1 Tax=Zizania palustris TaxID=103762 RepID=A0A8J5SIA9_ZIZPA|nr:hypothetical protein GUJ93_ZPchr0003g18338 [Zizania palustris]
MRIWPKPFPSPPPPPPRTSPPPPPHRRASLHLRIARKPNPTARPTATHPSPGAANSGRPLGLRFCAAQTPPPLPRHTDAASNCTATGVDHLPGRCLPLTARRRRWRRRIRELVSRQALRTKEFPFQTIQESVYPEQSESTETYHGDIFPSIWSHIMLNHVSSSFYRLSCTSLMVHWDW